MVANILNNEGSEGVSKFQDLTGQQFCNCTVLKYEGHSKWRRICNKCGKESVVLSSSIKKHGCLCWRNTVDEGYFQNLDTPDKAYFFGFLFADGYVNSKFKTCKLDVQERDVDILEKFKKAINWSGNINQYVAKKGHSYRKEDAIVKRIHIVNQNFANILESHGLVPHREKSSFPFKELPPSLYLDFIRGYFDGNGSVSISQEGYCYINFCGGTNLLKDIDNIMLLHGIHFAHYPRRPENPDNDQMMIKKQKEKIRFLDLMYANATTYLNRKYQKYLIIKNL